jgi:hypothetical protein
MNTPAVIQFDVNNLFGNSSTPVGRMSVSVRSVLEVEFKLFCASKQQLVRIEFSPGGAL